MDTEASDGGFATSAAIIVCLSVATVASATLLLAITQLKGARADVLRLQITYALDGAHMSAASTLRHSQSRRLGWRVDSPAGSIVMLAEPEWQKLGPGATADESAAMPTAVLKDPRSLQRVLGAASPGSSPEALEAIRELDGSRIWRRCGRSFVSPWGEAKELALYRSEAPSLAAGGSPSGQTWRIVASLRGWVDDRTEIITGDPYHPTILRDRRYDREREGPSTCDEFLPPDPTPPEARPATP